MLHVTIFSHAAWRRKEALWWAQGAVGRGVGNVERNSAVFTMTQLQAKKFRVRGKTMMLHAV
jgi:hypothetical protein